MINFEDFDIEDDKPTPKNMEGMEIEHTKYGRGEVINDYNSITNGRIIEVKFDNERHNHKFIWNIAKKYITIIW